jgi:hypothetical protein
LCDLGTRSAAEQASPEFLNVLGVIEPLPAHGLAPRAWNPPSALSTAQRSGMNSKLFGHFTDPEIAWVCGSGHLGSLQLMFRG